VAIFQIGIDTSHNKEYIGLVYAYSSEIDSVYAQAEALFRRNGWHDPLHWREIPNKIKDCCTNGFYNAVNKSRLGVYVFHHTKLQGEVSRETYLRMIPNELSRRLERTLQGKHGRVKIDADNDFYVKNVPNATQLFLERLLQQTGSRLIGTQPAVRKVGNELRMTIKQAGEKYLEFEGTEANRDESKAIQLADLCLGYRVKKPAVFKQRFYYSEV